MAESSQVQTGEDESPKPQRPELTWSDEIYSPDTYRSQDRLPCVVRMEEKSPGALSQGLKLYQRQPIMLYARTVKKVAKARTIHKEKDSGMYFEVGQTLLLPEDYEGWFEMVPPDFGRATCFRSIGELAETMPKLFFTRSNIKAIRIQKEEEEEQKIFERKIPAGSVLKVESVFTATWKSSAITGVFKKSKTEWTTTEVKYLKCIDVDQKEILLPLTQKGKFNALYEKGNMNKNSVYRMKDILSDMTLPVKVRLLFGKAPVVPCIFTGMMVIREAATSENIVGSTVMNKRNVLFEVPIDASCSVQETDDIEQFEDLDTFKDAQKLCKKYAMLYSQMIKLSPELDTDRKVIQHIPTVIAGSGDPLTLDLIGDISLTDDPRDIFMESDTDSAQSEDQTPLQKGTLIELKELRSRNSTTNA